MLKYFGILGTLFTHSLVSFAVPLTDIEVPPGSQLILDHLLISISPRPEFIDTFLKQPFVCIYPSGLIKKKSSRTEERVFGNYHWTENPLQPVPAYALISEVQKHFIDTANETNDKLNRDLRIARKNLNKAMVTSTFAFSGSLLATQMFPPAFLGGMSLAGFSIFHLAQEKTKHEKSLHDNKVQRKQILENIDQLTNITIDVCANDSVSWNRPASKQLQEIFYDKFLYINSIFRSAYPQDVFLNCPDVHDLPISNMF